MGSSIHTRLYELPEYSVTLPRVANEEASTTYSQPVSLLRFEPTVDVQSRNMAEGQGDVSIRGGTFENTGVLLGSMAVYDPQTGHYTLEIPVAPAMLSFPEVVTGATNAFQAFNATAGSVRSNWRTLPARTEASIEIMTGEGNTNAQSFYLRSGQRLGSELTAAFDISLSRSGSNGMIEAGDHQMKRLTVRGQLSSNRLQIDCFVGYQDKFFGWPNMYTPFGSDETEDIQTLVGGFNVRLSRPNSGLLEVGLLHRKNNDHYIFDRETPSLFQAIHETRTTALGIHGRENFDAFSLVYTGHLLADEIDSTSLVHGQFSSRSYVKTGLLLEVPFILEPNGNAGNNTTGDGNNGQAHQIIVQAGAVYDGTNRDSDAVSPVISATYTPGAGEPCLPQSLYLSYSQSTEVPGYTALASSETSGLFRGNPDLARQRSRNIEGGITVALPNQGELTIAGFYRKDDDLTDWTFSFDSSSARTANLVDIDTKGVECFARIRPVSSVEFLFGYSFLEKSGHYGSPINEQARSLATTGADTPGDTVASFYALNYPRHRFTIGVTWAIEERLTLRLDSEWRQQEKNLLRSSSREAFLAYASLTWQPSLKRKLFLSLAVDNIFDSEFEEIPAVPAAPRQFTVSLECRL